MPVIILQLYIYGINLFMNTIPYNIDTVYFRIQRVYLFDKLIWILSGRDFTRIEIIE